MKATDYAHALYTLLRRGDDPAEVFRKLDTVLARRGHAKLKRAIVRELHRIVTARASDDTVTAHIARAADEKQYTDTITAEIDRLGATGSPRIVVDDSLIGGYQIATHDRLIDNSHKSKLLQLYRNIVHAA